jgi:hypothetical protein
MAKTDPEFFTYESDIIDTIATGTNVADWHIPPTEFGVITGMKAIYDPKWVNTNPATTKKVRFPLATEQRRNYRFDIFEPALNHFVEAWVKNNSFIPNDDKIAMGVHIDSDTHTTAVPPTTRPINRNTDMSVEEQTTFEYTDEVSKKRAFPEGVLRAEFYVKRGGAAPASDSELIYDGYSTNDVYTAHHTLEQAGQPAWAKILWANDAKPAGSGKGPLSPMITFRIT